MRRTLLVFLCLIVCAGRAAAEDDAVRKKLDDARATYDKEIEALAKAVTDWFDKREASARESGNKKLVEQIKAERETFVEKNSFAKVSPELRERRSSTRRRYEAALQSAIREYTRLKRDDDASTIEKELADFKLTAYSVSDIESALIGTWRVRLFDKAKKEVYRADWVFKPDGIVESNKGSPRGRWTIELDKKRVYTTWDDNAWETFDLPLNPVGATGQSHDGHTKEAKKIK